MKDSGDDLLDKCPASSGWCDRKQDEAFGGTMDLRRTNRLFILVAAACAVLVAACTRAVAQQDSHLRVPVTPPWALECWVWEDDHNTEEYTLELLKGYEEHDIPARTVLIDSPWSTRYNDFIVDEQRYPTPAEFFFVGGEM